MSFLTGSSTHSWEPVGTVNTTARSYWLNWRVLLCSIWLLMSVIFASILISRHEARLHSENGSRERQEEEPAAAGLVYEDEVWKPCLKVIHPAWLLAYRVVAFFVLLILLILNADVDGATIFYFYTQWTFTLITIYFGLGSLLSIYGCYHYQNKVGGDSIDSGDFEAGQGTFAATTNASDGAKHLEANQECCARQLAGSWGYVFQIIFQMNAGAVILTDCVFWFVIVPFLASKDYSLNFLIISMHTVNAVFLLGDTYLNCMRFPWFRIAYFLLWTVFYVVFQWIVHACVSLWWPYPFLELSSSFAPLWYFSVGLMHIPCFAIFALRRHEHEEEEEEETSPLMINEERYASPGKIYFPQGQGKSDS